MSRLTMRYFTPKSMINLFRTNDDKDFKEIIQYYPY